MTPYIKKIVELHKIHKAIEDKECNGGGNTPSGDITIDDVVKFIHDDLVKSAPPFISEKFPYTTWNDIPDINDVKNGKICKDSNPNGFNQFLLSTPSYNIGFKGGID